MYDYFLTFISNIRDRRVEDTKKVIRIYNAQKDKQITQCQWPKEKGQKVKQRSTKHYTQNKTEQHEPHYKLGMNAGAPGRVDDSCSTNGTRPGTLDR